MAFVPIVSFLFTLGTGNPSFILGLLSLLSVLFGLPLVMDRPGAWLTKLIQGRLDESFREHFFEIDRDDIAENVVLSWEDGELNWGMPSPEGPGFELGAA
ncbi:MAG TPA: hypothetical protein VFO12_12715 [Sphingomicrobium sp.]|nr:hypothetical protein [Sphingomicrobium sp.]